MAKGRDKNYSAEISESTQTVDTALDVAKPADVPDYPGTSSGEVKVSDMERFDRVRLHLDYLTQDLTALLREGKLMGPLKQCASKVPAAIPGRAEDWQPIKTMAKVFALVQERIDEGKI